METEKDIKDKIFGNDNITILISMEESGEYMAFPNFFDHPKALEVRRFSKMIMQIVDNHEVVSFL